MDILNNTSNDLNSESKLGSSVGDVLNSKSGNFNSIDSDSSSTVSSTPSPSSQSSTDSNRPSPTSASTASDLNFMLQHYSLHPATANIFADHGKQNLFNTDSSNNLINSILQELSNSTHGTRISSDHHCGDNNNINSSCNLSNSSSPSVAEKKAISCSGTKNKISNTSKNNPIATTITAAPPGLHKSRNKNSTMVNDQSRASGHDCSGNTNNDRPKNLGPLISNNNTSGNSSKMREANGNLTSPSNRFNDNIFSALANVDLSNLQTQFHQAQPQAMPSFDNFNLSTTDTFVPPFNHGNSFLTSSNSRNSPWSLKGGQQEQQNAFDELLHVGATSPFAGKDAPRSQGNPVGEIGSGLVNGNLSNNNTVDSLFSGLPFPNKSRNSRDIWLSGNDSSSSFFGNSIATATTNGHSSDMSSPPSANPASTPSSNASSGLFDQHVWSLNSDSANPWTELWPPSFAGFNNGANLESSTNQINVSDVELKRLLTTKSTSEKLTSLLDSTNTFEMKARSQLNEIMAMFKKYVLETTLTQDLHLCQTNFDVFFSMMKSDLSKFEASTFTMEELRLFQEIYTTLLQNREKFNEEKRTVEENFEQFTILVKNLVLSTAAGSIFMYDDNLLKKMADKLANAFNVVYSAKYNNIFLSLVKFYKSMIYSVPAEILNNLPLIIEQSKLMASNRGNASDPLFMAYRNFILELNKYNGQQHNNNSNNFPQGKHKDVVDSADHTVQLCNSKTTGSNIELNENKDMNNNKRLYNSHKDSNNKLSSEKEFYNFKAYQPTNSHSSGSNINSNNSKHTVFSHINHLKIEPSVYMPFYYPVDHHMLSLHGPIVTVGNRLRLKNPYYMPANRQAFEIIVETELVKSLPGPVVLEKPEHLTSNKSFNKLVARLKKHFPNIPIKQLVEVILQSKYAIMKKHRIQYGFSGFKIKDLVKYISEYICENGCIFNVNMSNNDAMKGAAKGVSWSKVASASNQSNSQLRMSPGASAAKDSASVVSSTASPSPSPSLISNASSSPPICALCKCIVINSATDDKSKLTVISCNHIFHKECIDYLKKVTFKPVCPLCDQFILRNEEFPSL